MLKNHPHQVYRDGYYLPYVLEIHGLALLEDDLVLVFHVNEPNFKPGNAVAIGHLAKKQELVVAHGIFLGVDGLNDVYDARHPRDSVEDYPVADDCREQNWCNLVHF